MSSEIRVPREIVNDDHVIIATWNYAEGDQVRPLDVVATVETSKALVDVEAGAEGFLRVLFPQGSEVAVGEVIGKVVKNRLESDGQSSSFTVNRTVDGNGVMFSRRARLVIDERGLDPQVFAGRGLVREEDVLLYLESEAKENTGLSEVKEEVGPPVRLVADVEATEKETLDVGLWQDARGAAKDRGRGLVWLAFNYVWRTWFLSNIVRWAPRFAILTLHRWRGVKIGSNCFIDPSAIIETAHPHNIAIGNDVRIAAQVVIMTHIKPPHFLRSENILSTTIAPVVLSDSCFIGVRAVVMPGITIGKAAVVASGAVVVGDVAAFTMVAGNPAKVVKKFPQPNYE